MPRERRRRRRRGPPRPSSSARPLEIAQPGEDADPRDEGPPRPWWRPTLHVVVAFSGGLWIGATLSFADTASAAGLLIGVAGLALGGARLVSNRIRDNRIRAARERARTAEAYDQLGVEVSAEDEDPDPLSEAGAPAGRDR